MKGDFSRLRHNRAKHYTSVLQQQGRVALDADANEQCAINEEIRGTEAIDIIGPFGGPEADAGFAISVSGNSIQIGAGRYYAQGLLCRNPAAVGYLQQQYLLDAPIPDSQLLNELESGAASAIQVFLEVWQRLVTSLDDPALLEPALGRADTAARLQTVWRVVAEPVAVKPALVTRAPTRAILQTAAGSQLLSGVRNPVTGPLSTTGGTVVNGTTPVGTPTNGTTVTGGTTPTSAPPDCCAAMYQQPTRPAPGMLSAQTTGASSDCSCEPTPAAGYRGLENQLYRIEIHQSGTESTATFKWSRENGSVLVGVTGTSGFQVQVDSLGMDANLGFASGQWVEIGDDTFEFGVPANQPGQLYQIQSITPGQLNLTVAPAVSAVTPARNAKLRRWDQSGTLAGPNAVPVSTAWLDLENGIQVQFSAGNYTQGDYWLIPARTASGEIEWPPRDGDGSAFQPPYQTEVVRAPLACIHWGANQQFTVEDCRRLFPPLTDVAVGGLSALHVTGINWSNDDLMTLDQLLAAGLAVSLDQAPGGQIDSSIFSVTFEVPATIAFLSSANTTPALSVSTSMPIDGKIAIQNLNVTWNAPASDLPNNSLAELTALLMPNQGPLPFLPQARVRVRLQGSKIFAGSGASQNFLDGQSFGASGVRADGLTPRTTLTLPSGAGAKASDFESWFFVAPAHALVSLTPSSLNIQFLPGAVVTPPVYTLTVNYPALTDTVVSLFITSTTTDVPFVVTVQPTVTVPKGQTSISFSVAVVKPRTPLTIESFQITASLPNNALGSVSSVIQTLTVQGF